jgi:hypothetical protein
VNNFRARCERYTEQEHEKGRYDREHVTRCYYDYANSGAVIFGYMKEEYW